MFTIILIYSTIARAIVHCRAVEEIFPVCPVYTTTHRRTNFYVADKARRAVLNIASETEITPTQLGHALKPAPRKSLPNSVPSSIPAMGVHRPMSPPQSLEERRSSNPLPPFPSLAHTPPRDHGLLLNLPEPLDDERRRELHDQQAAASRMLAPIKSSLPARASSPKGAKPRLSVSVPPRGEKGLRSTSYDGVAGSYEFDDDEDDDDNDLQDEEEEEDEQEQNEEEEASGQGSYLLRQRELSLSDHLHLKLTLPKIHDLLLEGQPLPRGPPFFGILHLYHLDLISQVHLPVLQVFQLTFVSPAHPRIILIPTIIL